MIHKILTAEQCAECKGCCVFDQNDSWEMPDTITASTLPGSDLLICDALTQDGCGRKAEKPIECALYPFRVMRLGSHRVIALGRFCKAVTELPLSHILQFADEKSGEFADLADKHPEIVKEYDDEYVILKVIGI